MQLSLSDYAAIIGVVFGAVGLNYFITDATVAAQVATVTGELRLGDLAALNDRDKLRQDFLDAKLEISQIVGEGVRKRSEEIMLSLVGLTNSSDMFVITLANMPIQGSAYKKFTDFSKQFGTETSLMTLKDRAIGEIRVKSIDDEKIALIQALVAGVDAGEMDSIQVNFRLDEASLQRGDAYAIRLLEQEIERLQSRLLLLK